MQAKWRTRAVLLGGKRWLLAAIAATSTFGTTGLASAAVSCPTTTGSGAHILHFVNYPTSNFNTGLHQYVYLGEIWYGSYFVSAVIVSVDVPIPHTHHCGLYLVQDENNNYMSQLDSGTNWTCFGSVAQDVIVTNTNTDMGSYDSSCSSLSGSTQSPLQYAGNILGIVTLGGSDHVHGGANGWDIIYGGTSDDDLDGAGYYQSYSNLPDWMFGEEGVDFMYGGPGDNTYLDGGPSGDQLFDSGGIGDALYGNTGDDCCLGDSNGQFSVMDCGPGTNQAADVSAGTTNCQSVNQVTCHDVVGQTCRGPE